MARKTKKKAKKVYSLTWVYEDLEEDLSFATKRMFGGLAVYYNGLMVLLLSESPGDTEFRGQDYGEDIWNGLLFPTFREHHESLMSDYPDLKPHPVIPKWLYLKMDTEDFEELALDMISKIKAGDERFGIVPKSK